MKLFNCILGCGLAVTVLLSGCQAGTSGMVPAKAEASIRQASVLGSDDATAKDTWSKKDSFAGAESSVTVDVDIQTENTVTEAPILRGKTRDITVDEVKRWAEVLFEGNTAYEPMNVKTKAQLESEISGFEERMNDKEALLEEYSGDEAAVAEYIEYLSTLVAALEKDYETAPDSYERRETDWTYHPYWYYSTDDSMWEGTEEYEGMQKSLELNLEADVNGRTAVITSTNRTADDYLMHCINFYYTGEPGESGAKISKTERGKADALALQTAKQLGFTTDEWALESSWSYNMDDQEGFNSDSLAQSDAEKAERYEHYVYSFVPVYANLPAFNPGMGTVKSDDANAAHYYYQNLEIRIENGEVSSVSWYSPLEITGTDQEQAKLLDMDTVYDCFRTQMQSEYTLRRALAYGDDGPIYESDAQIKVTQVKFAMMRIKKKDSQDFLIVPAWLFSGGVSTGGVPIYCGRTERFCDDQCSRWQRHKHGFGVLKNDMLREVHFRCMIKYSKYKKII